jgi:hypothetical protein
VIICKLVSVGQLTTKLEFLRPPFSSLAIPDWTMKAVDHIRDMADILEKGKISLENDIETLKMYASK